MIEWYIALFFLLGIILFFMAIGTPIALGFLAANIIGAWYFMGGSIGVIQVLENGFGALSKFSLIPIPLFLLMGELFFRTGLGLKMFNAIDKLLGKLSGRLSYVTVLGGTAFSTLSGSSMGSTALLGSLLVPEMEKRGYKKHMSIGPILGTGGLAIIIPPSALAVLLGTLAQIDINSLLLAGIIPGLLLALFYIILIFIQTKLDPSSAPSYAVEHITLLEKLKIIIKDIIPMMSIIMIIILLMINGFITPSESAALGVLGVIILAILFKCLTFESIKLSVVGALKTTLMSYLIVFGSATFSQLLAFSGASLGLINWTLSFELDPIYMLILMFIILLILGTFMEQISIMMLTIPFFFPLAESLGFDVIWFGLIMLLSLEISFSTPPLGLLLFIMKGVTPNTSMSVIYRSAIPYIICSLILVILLFLFPNLVTWLPSFVNY